MMNAIPFDLPVTDFVKIYRTISESTLGDCFYERRAKFNFRLFCKVVAKLVRQKFEI